MAINLVVLSAGAIRRSVTKVAQMFERAGGGGVSLDFAPAPEVQARILAGEEVDVVIASAGVLTALAEVSKIVPSTRLIVGRTRMAVMIRKGADTPDLTSMASFRQAMLNADVLIYNEGASGEHAAAIIDRLGLRSPMRSKIHVARRGADLIEMVVSQPGRVLGLAQLTNIFDQVEKGVPVAFGGLFPDSLQNITTYEVAVRTDSHNSEPARKFVRTFASTEARKLLAAAGLD